MLYMNPTQTLKVSTMITRACVELKEPSAQQWYLEERADLKKLPTWENFAQRVKTRFLPSNWKLDALRKFYDIRQGSRDFKDYVNDLQGAKNRLPGLSTKSYFAISDATFKNHLLFFAHPQLILRVLSQPSLSLDTIKFDSLINFMSTAWECLAAEGLIRGPRTAPTPPSHFARLSLGTQPSPGHQTALSPLTGNERQALRDAGGCFHCRRTPSSPGWTSHSARNCPGNPSRGISARYADSAPYIKKEPLAAVTSAELSSCILDNSDDEDDGSNYHVAAILPAADLSYSDYTGDNSDYVVY